MLWLRDLSEENQRDIKTIRNYLIERGSATKSKILDEAGIDGKDKAFRIVKLLSIMVEDLARTQGCQRYQKSSEAPEEFYVRENPPRELFL